MFRPFGPGRAIAASKTQQCDVSPDS